ncbi:MAG: cytochrome P450 [Acidobacteria bacterium]|nr:cytochrome P450 [Acidobacteriota bacterium]
MTAASLLDPAQIDEPATLYRSLVASAPVWRVPGTSVVVVSSFAAVDEALRRPEDFSSNIRSILFRDEAGCPSTVPFGDASLDVLATADPPIHTAHRRAVFPELVARRMAELRPAIEQLAEERLGLLLDEEHPEFMGAVGDAVPIRVISRLIGFADEDPEMLLAAAFDSTAMLAGTEPLDQLMACMARTGEIFGWIGEQLDTAVTTGEADGILSVVAAAVVDGTIERDAGLVMMHTLLSAGGESTTSLLGNAVHLLATRPDLQRSVRREPDLLEPFIEETLRLESPFRHHLRHAPRATQLGGVDIPAGSTVLLLWAAANRDPAEFDRPDDVVLDRSAPRHHLGFGRGLHFCVGAPLARLEAHAVLAGLLERTGWLELDPERRPQRVRSLMIRRFDSLHLRITPV